MSVHFLAMTRTRAAFIALSRSVGSHEKSVGSHEKKAQLGFSAVALVELHSVVPADRIHETST
jgi:hypothetical protein